jgi:ureidoacrylate peracid hydrolase
MSLPGAIEAVRAALLIVDMQNDFCAEGGFLQQRKGYDVGFALPLAERIRELTAALRAAGVLTVWIKSVYDFKYLAPAQIAKRGAEGCCMEGTWGADFFELTPRPGDPTIIKHTFSAFHDTTLDELLRGKGIDTLLVTGVATNVCVDSTLREGFFRGYHIVLVEDCVGSNNKIGHDGTLATVRTNFGTVVPARQLLAACIS